MGFNPRNCVEYSLWCGKTEMPRGIKDNKLYYRNGSSSECLKVGFGAGIYSEKRRHYAPDDLRQIRYIGDKYTSNLSKIKIKTTTQLISKMKTLTVQEKQKILQKALTKEGGILDKRAYNSVLFYLHLQGVSRLPQCIPEPKPKK
jgi:hypothetical protein